MIYYQLKITLNLSNPPIFRKILIDPEMKFPKFHDVLQTVMGWTNSHLHQFIKNRQFYGEPNYDMEIINYKNMKIKDLLTKAKDKITYDYDFGDSWAHSIVLEKIIELEQKFKAQCIEGKYACPPEDCGGIYGYYDFLKIIQDPDNEEHESMLDWAGGEFDPEYFDLAAVNMQLGFVQKPEKTKPTSSSKKKPSKA